jgi:Zn-dependent protease with chaperone function
MTYWLLTAALTCSVFTLVLIIAGGAGRALLSVLARRAGRYSPAARARLLFRLRVLPSAAAVVTGFGVTLPVFLSFEKFDTRETIPFTLTAAGIAGLVLMGRGVRRAAAAWRSTRAVARGWQQHGRPIHTIDAPIPAYAIEDRFPIVAVIGIARPMLFIADRVLRECTRAEVLAMVAHECAHLTARDNLRRFVMRACPDVFGGAGALERAWIAATEEAADQAASLTTGSPLDLAQSLVRVARLAPMRAPELASAFYTGGSVEERVRRLLDPPVERTATPRPGRDNFCAALLIGIAVAGSVAAAPALHQLMERAIRSLP